MSDNLRIWDKWPGHDDTRDRLLLSVCDSSVWWPGQCEGMGARWPLLLTVSSCQSLAPLQPETQAAASQLRVTSLILSVDTQLGSQYHVHQWKVIIWTFDSCNVFDVWSWEVNFYTSWLIIENTLVVRAVRVVSVSSFDGKSVLTSCPIILYSFVI